MGSEKYHVAQFSFAELCEAPLGAADYIIIASSFSTIFVRDIPLLSMDTLNPMRRFITLIDCLYDAGVIVHCLAEGPPELIFKKEEGAARFHDELFAFDRTISRLNEMRSRDYVQQHNERRQEMPEKNSEISTISSKDVHTL